ncbi:antibiotic biosynthesis monooxygenase [Mesobacillus maritimus]|uniref:antibiotic biosynthesis monooxygenase family protein n=1 Tax=Mesobacillus maritimus TaxID=1643336 RepID=UPI002041965C|nr:antibiotic biosynthesis monooxygenase family protein [Mesobacillus maritimus]MCM3584794.1 antibiotic biosynthesis monooxygenase [Mesobacillus maritimus]MCM3671207.1 antibiotic biosynthesis monooxygenase [Mesobacillus maritimus]
MVQETFLLEVKPGTEQEFEQAFQKAAALVQSAKGCIGSELQRCLEQENKYLVAIEWETVEDHLVGFKNSPAFEEMKSLIGSYYLHLPQVEHYQKVKFQ